jgi:hypothetical protein
MMVLTRDGHNSPRWTISATVQHDLRSASEHPLDVERRG